MGRRWTERGTPMPMTWADLVAWGRLTGRAPTPDEVWALMMLDQWSLRPGEPDGE